MGGFAILDADESEIFGANLSVRNIILPILAESGAWIWAGATMGFCRTCLYTEGMPRKALLNILRIGNQYIGDNPDCLVNDSRKWSSGRTSRDVALEAFDQVLKALSNSKSERLTFIDGFVSCPHDSFEARCTACMSWIDGTTYLDQKRRALCRRCLPNSPRYREAWCKIGCKVWKSKGEGNSGYLRDPTEEALFYHKLACGARVRVRFSEAYGSV